MRKMRRDWLLCTLCALLLALTGCGVFDGGDDNDEELEPSAISQNFATSLHGTRAGKATWFNDSDGFGSVVNVRYEDLPCVDCHDTRDGGPNDADGVADGTFTDTWPGEPNCLDCHETVGDRPSPDRCLGCHGRQATEIQRGFTDVHRDGLGWDCSVCHTSGDVHGDGTAYTTLFEPGAVDANCSNSGCHSADFQLGRNAYHDSTHMDAIDCSACHMQSALACYNCHFDNEGLNDGSVTHSKFASAQFGSPSRPWRFLVNRVIDDRGNTKIFPGSMQSLMADATAANFPGEDGQGASFVAIGPYFSHSIQKNAITCDDCHASPALQQYVAEGEIDVVKWKAEAGVAVPVTQLGTAWQTPSGVIPIPPDAQTALNFDFVDLVNPAAPLTPTGTSSSDRVLFKRGADVIHFLDEYVTPLTAAQMESLSWFATSLHSTRAGKETWFTDSDGFGSVVTVAYDELPCVDCHDTRGGGPNDADGTADGSFTDAWPGNPNCGDCHGADSPDDADFAPVAPDTCLGCHGRQATEIQRGFTDVHRDGAGMVCVDCHSFGDIHGDGTEYTTLFEPGAVEARCSDCHDVNGLQGLNAYHDGNHFDTIDCSACHMQSALACYNCHFDNEGLNDGSVDHGKFASGQFGSPQQPWRFLVNRVVDDLGTTKIFPGSMQSLMADATAANFPGEDDQGATFVAIGPYYSHSIQKNAITCDDCHASPALQQYVDDGEIDVVRWKADAGVAVPASQLGTAWDTPSGVIPIPPDAQTVLNFDFVDLVDPLNRGSDRVLFKRGADVIHFLDEYVTPLRAAQMDRLSWFATSLHSTRNGKETWFSDVDPTGNDPFGNGFGQSVTVAYDELPCADCHDTRDGGPNDADGVADGTFTDTWPGNPNCGDCHEASSPDDAGFASVPPDTCYGCHGRQAQEAAAGLANVHEFFPCAACHSFTDLHGDGTEHASLFDDGAVSASCSTATSPCHGVPEIDDVFSGGNVSFHGGADAHEIHVDKMHCSACHMESAITCYNCHFDNEVDFHQKFPSGFFGGTMASGNSWRFLVNRVFGDGSTMVYPGSMQTLVSDKYADGVEDDLGVSFVAIGPYFAHAIMPKEDTLDCEDCHATPKAIALVDDMPVDIVRANQGALPGPPAWSVTPQGVIPVPADLDTLFNFDFVDLVDPAAGRMGARKFFKAGADVIHMPSEYVAPLTEDQMEDLSVDCSGCHPRTSP